jgi:hypothetical protein
MSPGQQRKHRYAPWEDVAPPEPKTKAEAAALARTWPEWEAAQPGIGMYGGRVLGVPWALDWQRNPRALLPPGFIWVRCLCFATICRPSDWRGRVLGRTGGYRAVRPAFTVGDRCGGCGAPYQRLERRDGPYVPPEGFHLNRCLCGVRVSRFGPESGGCSGCGVPLQEVAHSDQGYEVTLELGDQPGWREYLERNGLLGLEEAPPDTPAE